MTQTPMSCLSFPNHAHITMETHMETEPRRRCHAGRLVNVKRVIQLSTTPCVIYSPLSSGHLSLLLLQTKQQMVRVTVGLPFSQKHDAIVVLFFQMSAEHKRNQRTQAGKPFGLFLQPQMHPTTCKKQEAPDYSSTDFLRALRTEHQHRRAFLAYNAQTSRLATSVSSRNRSSDWLK